MYIPAHNKKLRSLTAILIISLVVTAIPLLSQNEYVYAESPAPVELSVTEAKITITVTSPETMSINVASVGRLPTTVQKGTDTPIIISGGYDNGAVTTNNITVNGGNLSDPPILDISINNIGISSDAASPITLKNKANVKLSLSGENSLTSTSYEFAALNVSSGNTIDIFGEGKLTALAKNSGSAGIGGNQNQSGGNIRISGGIINALTVGNGAAIGSGQMANGYTGNGGNIKIAGGIVSANKPNPDGQNSAGIGGGEGAVGGNIEISGGQVTTYGKINGAGIGGGKNGGGGTIKITGGTVFSCSGSLAASIGGGYEGSGANVIISGKNTRVQAIGKGGNGEIGSGEGFSQATYACGSIDIDGGAWLEIGARGILKSEKAPVLRVGDCKITGAGVVNPISGLADYVHDDLGGKYVKVTLSGTPSFYPARPPYLKTSGNVYTVKEGTAVSTEASLPDSGYSYIGWYNRHTGELYSTAPALAEGMTVSSPDMSSDFVSVSEKELNGNVYIYIDYPFDDSIQMTVDGGSVDPSKIKAESGSTKITIFDSYRKTLEPGDYFLNISSAGINVNNIKFSGTYTEPEPEPGPGPGPGPEQKPIVIEPVSYKVSFDVNGGNSLLMTSTNIQQGKTYGLLPTPSRKGYTFKGWFTARSDGIKITNYSYFESNSDHTLYARWSSNTYKVKLNANKGKVSKKYVKRKFKTKYGKLPTPKRPGYKFKGWYTRKKGGTKIKVKMIMKTAKTTTIYAHWKKK